MRFYPLTGTETEGSPAGLPEEYEQARAIGKLRIGGERLYFRSRRKVWYISYADIRRCYRRVLLVPLRMCCGTGDLGVENLVIEGDKGELASVELPGKRAAEEAMRELAKRLPAELLTAPAKPAAAEPAPAEA